MFLYVFTSLIEMDHRFGFFICILVQGICLLVAYDPRGRLVHVIPFTSAGVAKRRGLGGVHNQIFLLK